MDTFKNLIKNFVKSLLKSKIVKIAILLIFILAVLLPSFVYYITIDDGTYKEGDWESTPYVASTYTQNVNVGNDGITSDTTAQELWDKMIDEGCNVQDYLDTPEELEKLMNAEIITQYPKIGAENAKLDGIIEFERHQTDGTSLMLKYIDIETFNKYKEEKNTSIIEYFTVDENGNVLIGIVNQTTEELTSNDSEMILSDYTTNMSESNKIGDGSYSKTEYDVQSKSINYKSAVSKYTMPFQYLWSLIVIGDDKGVGLDLADLVEDSQIIISIYDNITTTVNTTIDTYNREKKIDVSATATATTSYGGSFTKSDSWEPVEEWEENDNYQIKHVITYKNNTPVFDITKADVWIVDYSKEYTYQASQQTLEETNEKDLDDTEYIDDADNPVTSEKGDGSDLLNYDNFKDELEDLEDDAEEYAEDNTNIEYENGVAITLTVSADITSCKASYYKHNVNRHEKNINTVSAQKYVAGNIINNPKVEKKTKEEIKNGTGQDNFVTILCDKEHIEARKKITLEIPSWLFELLETNPDTVNMVDLTKYLLYKVTNKSYGVTEYDFGVYENTSFSTVTDSIYGDSIQEKVWFMLKDLGYSDISAAGAMGNIHYESGSFSPNSIERGYTETTGGIGICQWTNNNRGSTGRNTNLRDYATSKGTTWQDENIQVEFLRGELTKGGGADGYAVYQLLNKKIYYGSELACESGWKNATTVEDATKAFCYSFERPGKEYAQSSMSTRISYAWQYYNMYSGMEAPQELDTQLTGDNKAKMESMISQAIKIANDDRYQYSQSFRESQYYYDCSSFVSRLYTQYFGISRLDSGSAGKGTDNIRANCKSKYTQVSMTSLQPGDILWRDGHVALYIGNNQTAEAASTRSGIVVRTMGNYTEAFRIIR